MPIQINEIVVRTTVGSLEETGDPRRPNSEEKLKEEEIVALVFELLNKKNER